MMSSAIPARLQFQCGHAAMVTLPRVKGETTAQRNERVAREKSAALARPCDFCLPPLEVAMTTNGTHAVAEPVLETEPMPAIEVLAIVEPEVIEEREPIETIIVAAEPDELVAEEIEAPLELEVVEVVEIVDSVPLTNGTSKPHTTRRRRAKPAAQPAARGQHYLVTYRTEQVIQAAGIHDAVRKLA